MLGFIYDKFLIIIMKTSVLDFVGNTPCINIEGVYVKLEFMNPSGSTKDRIAKYIINKAERTGKLKKGYKVVEATSGNSGIAFSMVCAAKGYKMVVIMPKGMSEERKDMMEGFGAKVILTPKRDSVEGAVEKELELSKRKNYYLVKQFENPWNVEAHEKGLGKEIIKGVGKVDCFVAGVGTGGTLVGVGKALRNKNKKVWLVGVEPAESPILSGGKEGKHMIEGIGDGFVPKIISDNPGYMDQVIKIKSEDAIKATQYIAKRYGLFVGISSGANFLAAKKLKKQYKKVVTVFPDGGERYFSLNIF